MVTFIGFERVIVSLPVVEYMNHFNIIFESYQLEGIWKREGKGNVLLAKETC